jgi:hypothetical protein
MGFVPSSSTQTLYAYLTQTGRKNLVFSSSAAFQIKYFSLHDNDVNYKTAANIVNFDFNNLPKGLVPDITGDNDECIKSISQAHIVDPYSFLVYSGNQTVVLTPLTTATASTVVYGCTDPTALNYNSGATIDDGSCVFPLTPPPSQGRMLTLKFEYPINLTTPTEQWVHTLDINFLTKTTWSFGSNINGTDPKEPKFSIILLPPDGDTNPITQEEKDSVSFWLELENPYLSTFYIDSIAGSSSITTGSINSVGDRINFYFSGSSNNSIGNTLYFNVKPSYFNGIGSLGTITTVDIDFRFVLKSNSPNVTIPTNQSRYRYKGKVQGRHN